MEIAGRRREQEVWQACDDLWALSGDMGAITGDAIRERLLALGKSRGSPNEIYKYRKSWSLSRGVVKEAQAAPSMESDPISRAVRLVHEKLQSEAQEQIEALHQQFSEALEEKEKVLTKEKENLADLVHEYGVLQQDFSQLKGRFKNLEEQHLAEIEIRKVTEKELAIEKARFKELENAHSKHLREVQDHYQQSQIQLKDAYLHLEKTLRADILRIELENKTLGHEFSEKLNLIKLEHYQSEIQKRELEKNIAALKDELLLAEQKIIAQDTQLRTLIEECRKWQNEVMQREMALSMNNEHYRLLKRELREAQRAMGKRDTKIARLRMMIFAEGPSRGAA